MMVRELAVAGSALEVIPEADFADAFEMTLPGKMSAMEIARAMVDATPKWVKTLMKLRDAVVKPFGLKTESAGLATGPQTIGFFPIISAAPSRAVLGLDDRHLDFRLVVDAEDFGNGQTRAIVSTVLKRHNAWGRIYLAVVLPFHKMIVPAMMRRIRV